MSCHQSIRAGFRLFVGLLLAASLAGCITKAKANAQARAEYLRGFQTGLSQRAAQPQTGFPMQPQEQLQPQFQQPQFEQPLLQPPQPLQPQPQPALTQNVTIVGPVINHFLPWGPGLTLRQAIADARYTSTTDPSSFLVQQRDGTTHRMDLGQLLAGQDMPLQPGDIVQIK